MPDVVFLDIEMPEMSGFDVLAQLRTAPLIVFATVYDEYAVQAFEANAIDYLLRPVQPARLTKTIEKIRTTLEKPPTEYESLLRTALSQFRPGPPPSLRRGAANALFFWRRRKFCTHVSKTRSYFFIPKTTDSRPTGR
jgi:DNA-binding LytR/AlgR family response regulator